MQITKKAYLHSDASKDRLFNDTFRQPLDPSDGTGSFASSGCPDFAVSLAIFKKFDFVYHPYQSISTKIALM